MRVFPIRAILLVPLAACLLSGCYSLTVRTDVNSALASSVHCGSYAWAGSFRGNSPLRSTIANPINESRLRSAIATHLGGGVQDDASKADCLVGYGIGSSQVIDPAWGYPYPYWGWGPGYWGPYTYREGVIAIDIYDARSRQPLWHASVDQSLYGVSGAEAEKRIDAAVAAIFTKHPA
jgi:hypothetical protein